MSVANPSPETVRSPLSELPPQKIRDLPKKFLLEELELYYGVKPAPEVVETDYSLWECAETGLQFASPAQGGNLPFYEWVSQFPSYYPGERWEYGEVRRLTAADLAGRTDAKLLDVGCGKGDFLRSLDFIPAPNRFAVDFNEPAIAECRRQGFQAFRGTIDAALAAGAFPPQSFPVVTAFHCLEHVEGPVEFVRSMIRAVVPGGRLFISTPYSPMSFEAGWFDVMNHPPHHMTRWNLTAYQRLAETVGVTMRFFSPPADALRRAKNAFCLRHYGPNQPVGKGKLLVKLLSHLPEFAANFRAQLARRPIAADVILVEFTVPAA